MVTANHRINRKCTLGHFYNSHDPSLDWLANFAIAKISAGAIFTDLQNFGLLNNNPLYGRCLACITFIVFIRNNRLPDASAHYS